MDSATLLNSCAYFKGLQPSSRTALARVSRLRELRKADTLFLEGGSGEAVFVLGSGSLQLVKTTEAGKETVIRTVEPGEVFAEVILFQSDAYPVTCVAVAKSVVLGIPKREFHALLDTAEFRNDFIAMLMRRLRYLADRIQDLTAHDVEARLFGFLEQQYGRHEEYRVPLSKKAVAAAIDATPETLSRLLLRLANEKKLLWKGRTVRLPAGFWENVE